MTNPHAASARSFVAAMASDRLLTHRDAMARVLAREVVAQCNGVPPVGETDIELLIAHFEAADAEVGARF